MSPSPTGNDLYSLTLGPDEPLSCESLEAASLARRARITFSERAQSGLTDARDALTAVQDRGEEIYGVTTGFGPLVDYESADRGRASHGSGLLAHLSAGAGPLAPRLVARATCIARMQSLAQGYSAIRPKTLKAFATLVDRDLTPAIPVIGSVGASGDLTPLAHAARVLTGTGRVLHPNGSAQPAQVALDEAGINPVELDGRDALAIVNGTAFMSAYAALSVARAERLASYLERLTGWMYRLLGSELQALDPRLHSARGHTTQAESAAAIRAEATRDGIYNRNGERSLQEPYSLRCAPQVIGACRDSIQHARSVVEREINGVNDNPVVISGDKPAVLHGGNFQGQQVALAADTLNGAITQLGVLAERQIDLLLKPHRNGDAPLLLAWTPGATSGLAGAQITSTALVAELRHNAQMSGTASIPTNGGNQDVVSMGTLAARTAFEQTERAAPILAVLGMALSQLTHLREAGRADGPVRQPPPWMPPIDPIIEDRPLRHEIETLGAHILQP
jgi:histidine ammonia-lyase/tyrosine ammonia-lyase